MDTEKHPHVVILVQLFQMVAIAKCEQVFSLALSHGRAPYIILFMVSLRPYLPIYPPSPPTSHYLSITLRSSFCPSR